MANQGLEDADALDSFQSGCRPHHVMEMALVTLQDGLLRETDRGKMSLLILLNLSVAFDTVDQGVLLGSSLGWGFMGFL